MGHVRAFESEGVQDEISQILRREQFRVLKDREETKLREKRDLSQPMKNAMAPNIVHGDAAVSAVEGKLSFQRSQKGEYCLKMMSSLQWFWVATWQKG